MPTYEFICEKCKKRFTLMMKISEYEKKKFRCPKCTSKKVKQQITSFQTITSSKS
jgi:putative FmdB family regulatory protein